MQENVIERASQAVIASARFIVSPSTGTQKMKTLAPISFCKLIFEELTTSQHVEGCLLGPRLPREGALRAGYATSFSKRRWDFTGSNKNIEKWLFA